MEITTNRPHVDISILVCSKDRREHLERLVSQLLTLQSSRSLEIVVVEETDKPARLDDVIYIPHPVANKGIPFARNLALDHARGDVIIFVDDDCLIGDDWLDQLLHPLEDERVVGVQGGVTCPSDVNAIGWCEVVLGFPGGGLLRLYNARGQIEETREISTLNCAYRRWVIDRIGGFDTTLQRGSDYLLAKQVCRYGECKFIPGALVFHQPREGFHKIWSWFVQRGRADIDLIKTNRQIDLTYWRLLRSSLSVKLLIAFLVCLVAGHPFIVLGAVFLLFFIVQYRRYYAVWRFAECRSSVLLLLPVVKLTMDLAADWGRIRQFCFN